MYLGRIVEVGSREQLFSAARHPYTRALLSAAPRPDPNHRAATAAITGEPPSPLNPPTGCHFHTRCPLASDLCRSVAPLPELVAPGHEVRCHHHDHAGVTACAGATGPARRTSARCRGAGLAFGAVALALFAIDVPYAIGVVFGAAAGRPVVGTYAPPGADVVTINRQHLGSSRATSSPSAISPASTRPRLT